MKKNRFWSEVQRDENNGLSILIKDIKIMNYLAHLYYANLKETKLISTPEFTKKASNERIIGHYLGDFVKGLPENIDLRPNLISGITMHRKLDRLADQEIFRLLDNSHLEFRQRRYAGITFDMACDHFLARHWESFSDVTLHQFSESQLTLLKNNTADLPDRALFVLNRMEQYRWLSSYQDLGYLEQVFVGIKKRFVKSNTIDKAFLDITDNYALLEKACLAYLHLLVIKYA